MSAALSPRFGRRIAWQAVANFSAWMAFSAASVVCWSYGWWPITVLCWLAAAWFGHTVVLAFHEASHGHLHRIPFANEVVGHGIGMIVLVPLSAYRLIHGAHHAWLASDRDAELWPYVDPRVPRWLRQLCVALELTVGFLYTPLLFVRGVFVSKASPQVKRRIWWAYATCAAIWATILALVTWLQVWEYFLVGYVAPAFLGGSLQSLRKLTEHLGLLGNTPDTAARTIVPAGVIGQAMLRSMLNVTHHAAHHHDAGTRFDELPAETQAAALRGTSQNVFPSFYSAWQAMLPSLADPRIGGQWRATTSPAQARTLGPGQRPVAA